MKIYYTVSRIYVWAIFLAFFCGLLPNVSNAQLITKITDYGIFGGTSAVVTGQTAPASPGYGVILGPSSNIQGGNIGSYKLVQSTGSIVCGINAAKTNIYSGGTVVLANSNSVAGNITAANSYGNTGTILSVGASASLNSNIDVNGDIVIGSGAVTGTVVNPPGSIYKLNNVIINNTKGTPTLPELPSMPPIKSPLVAGTANKTSGPVDPGSWGNLTLGNNRTVTLNGPGTYIFKAITTTGPNSTIVYDFKGASTGDFLIYVVGDVNLNRTSFRIVNGGSATRIYMEVQGKGLTNTADNTAAFIMSNGSNGTGNTSGWFGALWVPNAGIKIGTPNGPLMTVNGSLWSGTQVNLVSNVNLTYAEFGGLCSPPVVDAGPDKPFNFDGITTLNGSSGTGGGTFKWTAPSGGGFTTGDNLATVNVLAPGVYQLTYTAPDGCSSTDEVLVSNKIHSLIGSELTSVYYNNPTGLPSPFFMIADGKIRIDVIVKVNNYDYVLNLLQQTAPINYGLTNIVTNGENGAGKKELIITGDYPIANLLKLNDLADYINYCRPFYEPFSSVGIVTSAGDTTMRSHFVRNGYGIDGSGIKVGVISNSLNTITNGTTAGDLNPVPGPPQTFTTNTMAQDISNGDLPAVTNLQDYPIRSTDEGRAMLQIVHDVAPGAELYFRTGFRTAGDFATGIKELKQAGCKIIVDDVSYINEPYLTDGVVAQAVDEVTADGVAYFSAAGNFANRSYEKNFVPAAADAIGFPGKKAHNFATSGVDIFQHITMAPGNYTIVLQWVDNIYSNGQFDGTQFDLDMFWTSNTNGTALKGFNRDNTGGDPVEIMPFIIDQTTDANFLIVNNTMTGNPERIKFIMYRGDVQILEYSTGTSTLVGQQNALGAIAVGAARYDKAPPYLATPLIESFSSIGGTMTEGVVRNKPDLVAPDGVNTTVKMGQDYPNSALDGYSNFFGTSAAAPHAAAVAALIMQGKTKFLGLATTSPDDIRSLLQSTAVDMEVANNINSTTKFDFISGYGLVDADSAMRTFAAPKATLIELVVPPAEVPCSGVPFTISITGENFSRSTVVLLINAPGDTTRIVPTFISSTEVTVTINSCIGNPEIRAYTPPKAGTNGTDGGFSNSKFFFSASVTIVAPKITKKYGESLVPLSPEIKVDGVLLANTNPLLTLADIGLDDMTITTEANSSSDVGTYIVTPSRIFDEEDPDDLALLKKYSYKFTTGLVTIEKMPLTVTPVNKSVDYGHNIGKINFTYNYNTANVANPDSMTNAIKAYHEALLPGNALAVVKDFGKQQANGSTLSSTDLTNMNMIASFNAVKNSRKFTLSNDQLFPITDPNVLQDNLNIQYLVDIASESIYNYKLNPATAQFFSAYPGINSKALLSAASIQNEASNIGTVDVNGSLLKVVSGSMEQMLSTTNGPIVPMVNGLLIQVVDAQQLEPASANTVQYVNDGSWVQINNGSLLKVVSGLLKLVNGTLVKVVSGESYVQYANGSLLKVVSGSLLKVVSGTDDVVYENGDPVQDSTLVMLPNGLVQYLNGSLLKVVSGSLLKVVSGSLLKVVSGSLLKVVSSSDLGTDAVNNNTAVIVDQEDAAVDEPIFSLGSMFGINMITGLDVGTQHLVPGILANPNFDITYGLGQVVINKATITVKANNVSRPYGENNQLTVSYSGFAPGDSIQNEGTIGIINVTGAPTVTTTATQYSPVGTYPITAANGTLASSKYVFSFVNGELTITDNPCLKTHDPTNFVSTTNAPTSLWLNITIKVSGQLAADGDYIMYRAGTVTFNNININSVPTTTHEIPNGKIIAITGRTSPFTYFDLATNTWITEVPPGFASTSDIVISGAIINSSNGFIKKNNKSNSVVKGIFYSNKNFTDQWAYAMAAYRRPAAQNYYLTYPFVDGPTGGGVASINGTYRAGTPTTALSYLVEGGTGNGGTNYTGSPSNQNNFTACIPSSAPAVNRGTNNPVASLPEAVRQELLEIPTMGEIKVFPNPAFADIALSYVPAQTGTSKIAIFTIDGRKVMESNNGVWEAGKKYIKMVDVSRLARGVYVIQVIGTDKITNTKFIISR